MQDDERLKVAIKAAHVQTRETYGPLRMWPELVAQGFDTGCDRVVRLRRELGLRCKQKRKFKATTNSKHGFPVAENLLNQTFAPTRPDEAWVTDITYVSTGEGWLYLAGNVAQGELLRQCPYGELLGKSEERDDSSSEVAIRADAESAIKEYIEISYNRPRHHSRLGYIAPAKFVENFSNTALAA